MSEGTSLVQWAGEAAWDLQLPVSDYRVRFSARGMDQGRDLDTRSAKEPRADSYLLQFWPAPPGPDQVIRQTSEIAAYWHEAARGLPSPPAPEQRAEAERLARQAKERDAEDRRLHYERWEWGGRLPNEALRGARASNVLGLLTFDSDLVHTLGASAPGVQHTVALLSARRACEAAGLTDVPWVADALAALEAGRPLPPPFDDPARMSDALRSDPGSRTRRCWKRCRPSAPRTSLHRPGQAIRTPSWRRSPAHRAPSTGSPSRTSRSPPCSPPQAPLRS
ncbi:hypothetical protein SMICM304S_11163 [Streptomyces microflavus]